MSTLQDVLGITEAIKAEELIWNNKFAEAEALLTRKETCPRQLMIWAESQTIQSFLTMNTADMRSAEERLKIVKHLAEQQIKAPEKAQFPAGYDVHGITSEEEKKRVLLNLHLDLRLIQGEATLLMAAIKVAAGQKIKGILLLRNSWKLFEGTLQKFFPTTNGAATSFADSRFDNELVGSLRISCGFFYWVISVIPSKFLRFAELAGFKADRTLGLKWLREVELAAGTTNRLRGSFAAMVLLFGHLVVPRGLADLEESLVEAAQIIERALHRQPQGTAWNMMASHCFRKRGNLTDGLKHVALAVEGAKSIGRPAHFFIYELGSVYLMQLDWKHGIEILEPLLSSEGFRVKGTCSLQVASAYLQLGNREKAIETFKLMPKLIPHRSSSVDNYVTTMANRYLANGAHFSAFELLFVRRDLAKMSSVIDECLRQLEVAATNAGVIVNGHVVPAVVHSTSPSPASSQTPAGNSTPSTSATSTPSSTPTPSNSTGSGLLKGLKAIKSMVTKSKDTAPLDFTNDNRASYLMLKGTMLKYKRDLGDEEAMACLREVVAMDPKQLVEKWYLAWSYFELCESYFYNGNPTQAALMLKNCIACKNYLWEDSMKLRIKVAADQLKRGPTDGERLLTAANRKAAAASSSTAAAAAPVPAPAAIADLDDDDGEAIDQEEAKEEITPRPDSL